jgi:hypothetical protein
VLTVLSLMFVQRTLSHIIPNTYLQ